MAEGQVIAPTFLREEKPLLINCLIHSIVFDIRSKIIRDINLFFFYVKVLIVIVQNYNFDCWKVVTLQQYVCWFTHLFASLVAEPLTQIDLKTLQSFPWIFNSQEQSDAPRTSKSYTSHFTNKCTSNLHLRDRLKQEGHCYKMF